MSRENILAAAILTFKFKKQATNIGPKQAICVKYCKKKYLKDKEHTTYHTYRPTSVGFMVKKHIVLCGLTELDNDSPKSYLCTYHMQCQGFTLTYKARVQRTPNYKFQGSLQEICGSCKVMKWCRLLKLK